MSDEEQVEDVRESVAEQAKRDYDDNVKSAYGCMGEAARYGQAEDGRAVALRGAAQAYATLALAAATRLQADIAERTFAAGQALVARMEAAQAELHGLAAEFAPPVVSAGRDVHVADGDRVLWSGRS